MKFNTYALMMTAVAAQVQDADDDACDGILDDFEATPKWSAPANMEDWYTCSGHDDKNYLTIIEVTADDIGNPESDYENGYARFSVKRTEPVGDTSYIQIYYDSFITDAQQLDYECIEGCEYNELVYIGRSDKSDQTGDGFYNGYLVLALSSDFNRDDRFILALKPVDNG